MRAVTIASLEYFLGAYVALPDVVDETSWASFPSRVRERRPAAESAS
jgi:hypothetical protein